MHILWINEVADLTGGCERYIADTASFLKQEGVTSSLLYGVEGWTEPKFMRIFEYAFPMVDLIRQIKEIDPDMIYIQRLTGTTPLKQLLSTGKPVIRFYHDHKLFCLREHKYTVRGSKTCTKPIGLHCFPCLGFINRSNQWPGIKFASLPAFRYEQKINKKLAGFIVGSNYMKDHLIAHGFAAQKIHVNQLYTISDVHTIQKEKQDFLFAGQLVRGKGVDIMLQSYANLQTDNKLIICGSGKQEKEFKQLAKKLGIQDRVVWKGKVQRQELDKLYAKAICFLMPSRVPETFGLSGLEAMSHGTPVIATKVGGMEEWLQDGITGIAIPSNDSEALTKAMQNMLSNDKMRKKMGEQAQQNFKDKFTPEIHIKKLIKIFTDLK